MASCTATVLSGAKSPFLGTEFALLCNIIQKINPMALCDLPTLERNGKCFCSVTSDPDEKAELALLCGIWQAMKPGAVCDVGTLLKSGKCFCSASTQPVQILKLQLLCEIQAVAHP